MVNKKDKKIEIEKEIREKSIEKIMNSAEKSLVERQKESEEKQLKWILITISFIIGGLILGIIYYDMSSKIDYEGFNFQVINEGKVRFYYTQFLIDLPEKDILYNFFIRNNPKHLEDIPFGGEIKLKNLVVLNVEEELNCDGDGVISVANMNQFFNSLQITRLTDPNATCDLQNRYSYINIISGNETRIDQIGISCYEVVINNCDILEGTERLMLEILKKGRETRFIIPQ